MKQKILQMMFAALVCAGARAQVNSGSNGSDGALTIVSENRLIDMTDHPDGIYQYTSVYIAANTSVAFIPNANNTPVYWFVQSNVVINGTVDVSGQIATNSQGGIGGPGGWGGGNGDSIPSPGQGPGGGVQAYGSGLLGGNASFGSEGNQNINPTWYPVASSGSVYGNSFLLPLIGGSGGGGAQINSGGGGGGGGAILVAAATIQLNGLIKSKGGTWGNYGGGGQGSGGAIRLCASKITGSGNIDASGGIGNSYIGYVGGSGRIRLDTYDNEFSGSISGVVTSGSQFIIIPTSGQLPQLTVTSVGGVPVSASPTGVLSTPDAVLSAQQSNPIPVVVSCANLPLNTQLTVSVRPANGSPVSATGYNTTGTLAASKATISIVMPRGGGLIYATAATGH